MRARWAVLRSRGRVVAAPGVALGRHVQFQVGPGGRVRIGAGTAIGARTKIRVDAGELSLGEGTVLGDRCVIELRTRSVIEGGARLADEVVVHDHRRSFVDCDRPVREQEIVALPILIGSGARIGPRAFVGAGVTVGARAQISAYAVIESDVAPDARVLGVPSAPMAKPPRKPTGPGAF